MGRRDRRPRARRRRTTDAIAQRRGACRAPHPHRAGDAPDHRDELAALKDKGFTGYLIKPVRAASLAMRFATATAAFDDPDPPYHDTTRDAATPPATGLAVLVAEDNEINALLARALLTRLGHRPTVATSGAQAVDSWLAARAAGGLTTWC